MKADQHLMPDIRCFSIDMMRDLAADVTDYTLQESFCAHYQSVKGAKVITDHVTGRSKGYGFGRFSDEAEHQHAMTEMNGQFCSSRLIRVGPTSNKKYVGIQLKGSRVASLVGLLLLKLPHEDSDYLSTEEMKTLMMIVLIGLFHYFDNEGTTPEIRRCRIIDENLSKFYEKIFDVCPKRRNAIGEVFYDCLICQTDVLDTDPDAVDSYAGPDAADPGPTDSTLKELERMLWLFKKIPPDHIGIDFLIDAVWDLMN